MTHHEGRDPQKSATRIEATDLADQSTTLPGGIDRHTAATEVALRDFKAEVASLPGFRTGSARAPGQYVSAVEVTSWLQVPAILNQLQNEGVEKLRLIFPTPTLNSFVAAEHVAAFIKEQHQISRFIKENHAKPIEEIKQLLAEKIEHSFSLSVLKSRPSLGDSVTASAWVDASLISSNDSRTLSVSTLFPVGQKSVKSETTTKSLALSLLESASNDRPSIVTVPNTNPQKLEDLAKLLQSLVHEGGDLHNHYSALATNTKVWVGPHSPKIIRSTAPHTVSDDVKEYSLTDFISTYAAASLLPPLPDKPPSFEGGLTEAEGAPKMPQSHLVADDAGNVNTSSSPAKDDDEMSLDPSLANSSPQELILNVERRFDPQTRAADPLAEATLPKRPDDIVVEHCIHEVKEDPEAIDELLRLRRLHALHEQELVEKHERNSDLTEKPGSDGGFA